MTAEYYNIIFLTLHWRTHHTHTNTHTHTHTPHTHTHTHTHTPIHSADGRPFYSHSYATHTKLDLSSHDIRIQHITQWRVKSFSEELHYFTGRLPQGRGQNSSKSLLHLKNKNPSNTQDAQVRTTQGDWEFCAGLNHSTTLCHRSQSVSVQQRGRWVVGCNFQQEPH